MTVDNIVFHSAGSLSAYTVNEFLIVACRNDSTGHLRIMVSVIFRAL